MTVAAGDALIVFVGQNDDGIGGFQELTLLQTGRPTGRRIVIGTAILMRQPLLRLNAGPFGDVGPLDDFALKVGRKILRRTADDVGAFGGKP